VNKNLISPILLLALLLTTIAYARSLQYPFVYDDTWQIVSNGMVHSWSFLPEYFIRDVLPHGSDYDLGNYYRPVFQVWLLLNYKVGGLHPMWWHLTTLFAHLLVTSLVFVLARVFTRDEFLAGAAAILFGLHPIHIEAVTWISGVTEPLLAAVFLASFLGFLKCRKQGPIWLVASLAFYVVAMLAKETALVLPAIIFCYQWLYPSGITDETCEPISGRRERLLTATKSIAPYLSLTVLYLVARFFALKGLGHSITRIPFQVIIYTWPSLLLFYVRSLIWPFGLSAFYDTPYVKALGSPQLVVPAVILLVIGFLFITWSRRSRLVAFFSLWMLLPLLPVLNISVFKDGEIAHDRYLYLPSVGFCILLAYGIRQLKMRGHIFKEPAVQVLALSVVAIMLGIGTFSQSSIWASDLALTEHGVLVAPNNHIAGNNFAKELAARGNYREAIPVFQQVLARKPGYWLANFNLAFTYYQTGDLTSSEKYFRAAIKIYPGDAAEFRFLGFTLLEQGKNQEAETMLKQAINLDGNAPDQHYALGTILKQQNDFAGALKEFRLERDINPARPELRQEIAETETKLTSN
jgi:Flp pilus assembly protein TadD